MLYDTISYNHIQATSSVFLCVFLREHNEIKLKVLPRQIFEICRTLMSCICTLQKVGNLISRESFFLCHSTTLIREENELRRHNFHTNALLVFFTVRHVCFYFHDFLPRRRQRVHPTCNGIDVKDDAPTQSMSLPDVKVHLNYEIC